MKQKLLEGQSWPTRFKEAGDLKKMDDNMEHILALKDHGGAVGGATSESVDTTFGPP